MPETNKHPEHLTPEQIKRIKREKARKLVDGEVITKTDKDAGQ